MMKGYEVREAYKKFVQNQENQGNEEAVKATS